MQELINEKIKELKINMKKEKENLNSAKDRAKIYGEESYYGFFAEKYTQLYALQSALDILLDIKEEIEE